MIKNLLLSLVSMLFSSALLAQLTITPADSVGVIQTVTANNDEVVLYAYVKNDSSVDLTFRWRVASSDWPSGWDVSYCDNTNCLDLASSIQSTFILKADSTSILKMAYLPYLIGGESNIEMSVSIDGVASSSVTVKYTAKVTANPVNVGIRALNVNTLSLFPNPATNFIQIKGIDNVNDVNAIEIYSIIGKKIMSNPISSVNDLSVNIQNLEHGVYLVKLYDSKKSVFYTKTFVKK
jgi:hypothetical protein